MRNKELGAAGELSAANYLVKNKYKILEKNYKTRFGEIDIIAKDKEYIVFVEVKARTSLNYGLPCQAVDYRKQNVIGRVAAAYLARRNLDNQSCRFDIVEVLAEKDDKFTINHLKDAFQPNIY